MDDFTLGKVIQALRWEANYRKKSAVDKSVSKHFLSPQASLDPDFEKQLCNLNITKGKLLDIGTGTGEQAIFFAKKGFEVTATDVSPSAIKNANKLAAQNKVDVKFIEDNILLSKLTGQFDLIIDRGCFTLIPRKYKPEYIIAIKKLLNPNGWVFLKTDKKRNETLKLFKDDTEFREYISEESSYLSLNEKIVPATVLVMQKIHKETV